MTSEPLRQTSKVEYKPVATSDPAHVKAHKAHREAQAEGGNWAIHVIDSTKFQNFIGLVIVANGIVIGLETDIPAYKATWSKIENGFLAFFVLELLFHMWAEGCHFWNPMHPDFIWNLFDVLVIGIGVFDFSVTYLDHYLGIKTQSTGGFSTVFRMIRLMRILRLFRLLKFLKRLYLLAVGLMEAAKAIFWVTILMCFLLYICGIVLVKTVGQTPPADVHYAFLHERFGSIAQSMITLFVLMSSPNLPIYQDEVGLLEGRPSLCLFLIIFIMFGSFGMLAMLTGVINESMFENNEVRKEEMKTQHEDMRANFCTDCADLFEDVPLNAQGEAAIEDVKALAPQTLDLLEQTGVHIAHGDIMKFIENIDTDDSGTINVNEFVQAMEAVVEGVNPLNFLEIEKSVGHCTRSLLQVEKKLASMLGSIQTTELASQKVLQRLESEGSASQKTQEAMDKHLVRMDEHMQRIQKVIEHHGDRVHHVVAGQENSLSESCQRLLEEMSGTSHHVKSASSVSQDQIKELKRYMDNDENRLETALSRQTRELIDVVQAKRETRQPEEAEPEGFQNELSQQIAFLLQNVMDMQKRFQQIDSIESRLRLSASQEAAEMQKSMLQLMEEKHSSTQALFSAMSQRLDQVQQALRGVTNSTGGSAVSQQLECTDKSVQKVLEQWRAIGNEASLHGVVSRHIEEISKALQKFLDQKDSSESRLQLAVSSQIQDIAVAVQKLLHEKETRDPGSPVRTTTLEFTVTQQIQDMKTATQRQIDSTHEAIVKNIAELGGVLLDGVADLLCRNAAGQQEVSVRPQSEPAQASRPAVPLTIPTRYSGQLAAAKRF